MFIRTYFGSFIISIPQKYIAFHGMRTRLDQGVFRLHERHLNIVKRMCHFSPMYTSCCRAMPGTLCCSNRCQRLPTHHQNRSPPVHNCWQAHTFEVDWLPMQFYTRGIIMKVKQCMCHTHCGCWASWQTIIFTKWYIIINSCLRSTVYRHTWMNAFRLCVLLSI